MVTWPPVVAPLSHRHMMGQAPPTHALHGRKGLFLASGPWTGEQSGCSVTAETGGVSRQDRRKQAFPWQSTRTLRRQQAR